MNELTLLGFRYMTDKSYYHRFTEAYEEWLLPLRDQIRQVVEIGIYNGASLRMWRDYFPNATVIGADIGVQTFVKDEPRIKCYYVDQGDTESLKQLEGSFEGDVDLFIDDGSHFSSHQMVTMAYMLPRLKKGSIYILEDLHPSMHDTSSSSAYKSVKDWVDGKPLRSSHLNMFQESKINNGGPYEFKLYHRSNRPFLCWKCKLAPARCTCGEGDGDSVTLMIRKL